MSLSAAVLSAALAGCSSSLFESKGPDFKFFAKSDWSSVGSSNERDFGDKPVAPEELVDANGTCAGAPAAAPPAPEQGQVQGGDSNAQQPVTAPVLVSGGIGLGMTECQVVQRAGLPGNVQIGGGDASAGRTAVLTYTAGPWPGIYRFADGRLKEVERVAMPEPPKPVKPVKKKKAAPKTASTAR
ncbi:MAG: hypothetical protein JO237_01760 [Pseudolabrys sp.]|nr:hypothetical protein [Pseudolabrys sp.]